MQLQRIDSILSLFDFRYKLLRIKRGEKLRMDFIPSAQIGKRIQGKSDHIGGIVGDRAEKG